jgi:hypothetical protein
MERFNYPNLSAVRAESVEIIYLLECESYGRSRDQQEELEEQQAEIDARKGDSDYG